MTRTTIARTATALTAAALALAGCSTVTSSDNLGFGTRLAAELEGENEVPEEASATGTGGFAAALGQDGELCYEIYATGIAPASAAHIHRGAPSENGPPVVSLVTPPTGETAEACTRIERDLAQQILAEPEKFYVNVHNEPYPGGAIRGQLVQTPAP
jgi:hypothetical protein